MPGLGIPQQVAVPLALIYTRSARSYRKRKHYPTSLSVINAGVLEPYPQTPRESGISHLLPSRRPMTGFPLSRAWINRIVGPEFYGLSASTSTGVKLGLAFPLSESQSDIAKRYSFPLRAHTNVDHLA